MTAVGVVSATPRLTTGLKVGLAVALVAGAYHRSLLGLVRFLSADTPLAYLGLLPVLVLVLALVKARPRPDEARLPVRHVDWIIGVPLLGVAAFVAIVLPERLSYTFWTNRLDIIGIPFFAAGITALVFGSRVLWRVRLPLAALVLAWPLPYELVLDRVLDVATRFALFGVRTALPLVSGARAAGDAVFALGEGAQQFTVNVAPQCAGANSSLGFLLVGGAVAIAIPGSRWRKGAWLASGVALLLVLNVVRIVAIFWVGARWGERAAIEWLHPYAGLVLFTIATFALLAALPRFGLSLRLDRAGAPPSPTAGSSPRSLALSLAAALVLTGGLGSANAALARFDPFLGVAGSAVVVPLTGATLDLDGWSARHTNTYAWARQYFGERSTWHRYTLQPTEGAGGLVWLDVVRADRLQAFSDYGIEACYRFHDYELLASSRVEVGAAVPAQAVSFREPGGGRAYSVISWVTPVAGGAFERAVLITETDEARVATSSVLRDLARDVVGSRPLVAT